MAQPQNKLQLAIPTSKTPALSPNELMGLQDYWRVYEAHRSEIRAELSRRAAQRREFLVILEGGALQQSQAQAAHVMELQRRAIYDGEWEPYLESLRAQGGEYAQAGLDFQAWFDMIGAFRRCMRPHLLAAYGDKPEQLLAAMDGVDQFIEITLGTIGDSFLHVSQEQIRQQQESLRQNEHKFSQIFEKSAYGAALSRLSDGAMIDVNEAWCKISGYTRDEMIGKTSLEIGINPDGPLRERMLAELRSTGSVRNLELPVITKSGEHRLLSLNIDMLEINGQQCILNAALDITESRRSEDKLRRQEKTLREAEERASVDAKFRGLLEAAPDAMVVVNNRGIIEIINSQTEKLFLYERDELIGQPVEMLIPERLRAEHTGHRNNYVREPIARPMGTGLELYARRRDGSEFPVEISLSPLDTEAGQLVTAAIRDVTDRMQSEHEIQELNAALNRRATELEVANRELESFSYSVSHDLRSPLRTIDGFSQAILEDYEDQLPGETSAFLGKVRAAAQRMAKLIDDLLELSRISRIPVEGKSVDVSALATGVADELRQAEPERVVEFTIEPGLRAQADERLLRIALQNLMNNAWKFTSKVAQAKIEIGRVVDNNGNQAFFVRDNGAGFDMSYASQLFGAFQRLHAVTEFPGTGIGLATVQRIIHKHGGRIWAESIVNQGATFYFTLQPKEAEWMKS